MNKNISVSEIQCDLTDKIAKARALCAEVVTQYCEFDKADPNSDDERDRLNAYELCRCGKRLARYENGVLYLWCKRCKREVAIKLEDIK